MTDTCIRVCFSLRNDLETQAASLGIADRVAFVGFQNNPLPWIRHARALVSSSRYEGLGNVIVEAIACATPVVATDCPHGPSEILLGGQIGRLVAVGDSAALARAMQNEIDMPQERAPLAARASQFTAAACADAHTALFSAWPDPPPVIAFGMRLSTLRAGAIVDRILDGAAEHGVRLVVTPNVDHVRLLRNGAFAAAYKTACVVCPDGLPVLLYARLRGSRLRKRVTGCEIFHLLANDPRFGRHRVCVAVESEPTASALSHWAASRQSSNLTVLVAPAKLAACPESQDFADAIGRAAPTILVMTLGAPTSEIFVDRYRDRLGACWALCVGQAVRVELGLTQRAPAGYRLLGLEWLWRIRQEPRRLAARYFKAFAWFPVAVLRDLNSDRRPDTIPVLQGSRHARLG